MPTPQPDDGAVGQGGLFGDLTGTWTGTITESTGTQGIRFQLVQLAEVITGGVIYDSGKIDQNVTGTLEGDTLTIVFDASGLVRTYEGTVSDGTYSGTVTTVIDGREAPGGPGTFEVTKEE